jgi:hypothetical protein
VQSGNWSYETSMQLQIEAALGHFQGNPRSALRLSPPLLPSDLAD